MLGQQVEVFEQTWASHCGTAGAVGLANGLDAIETGLRSLGIGPGDEVITTALTAYATTLAIQRCGATPVFAEIDLSTACIDPASIERCISPATRAVLVVHLYGRAANLTDASLQVRNGVAAFERDSVLFDEIEYSWPVTAALMHVAARSGGRLHVLDFGGALGSSYFKNRFLDGLKDVRWCVVEQEHYVEAGRKHLQDERLTFCRSIGEAIETLKPNLFYFIRTAIFKRALFSATPTT